MQHDEPFLTEQGRDARMVGPEPFFVKGSGFAEQRQGAFRVARGTMRLGDTRVSEGGVQTVLAGRFEGDGERFLGRRYGVLVAAATHQYVADAFQGARGLYVRGE